MLNPQVTMDHLQKMATPRHTMRLMADNRRSLPGEICTIFTSDGLHGNFWETRSDEQKQVHVKPNDCYNPDPD